jgi:hypothetical protein
MGGTRVVKTRTASYVFLACLAIVGLWGAWGIHQAGKDIASGHEMIAQAEQHEDRALAEIERTIKDMEAEAALRRDMASGPAATDPAMADTSEWGSDTPE